MDQPLATRLGASISTDRFGTYLTAAGGDPVAAIRLYAWTVEASAAFWGPLHAVEVVARNAMHRELVALFGRPDWWNHPRAALTYVGQRKVADVEDALRRRGRPVTDGAVVAELPFGFWSALLGRGNQYEVRLWRPALHRAFPGYRGPRTGLHQQLDYLREFRNRIAHHEPIFARHLAADLASIRAVLGYVCPDTQQWVDQLNRVPAVLARRNDVCTGRAPCWF